MMTRMMTRRDDMGHAWKKAEKEEEKRRSIEEADVAEKEAAKFTAGVATGLDVAPDVINKESTPALAAEKFKGYDRRVQMALFKAIAASLSPDLPLAEESPSPKESPVHEEKLSKRKMEGSMLKAFFKMTFRCFIALMAIVGLLTTGEFVCMLFGVMPVETASNIRQDAIDYSTWIFSTYGAVTVALGVIKAWPYASKNCQDIMAAIRLIREMVSKPDGSTGLGDTGSTGRTGTTG